MALFCVHCTVFSCNRVWLICLLQQTAVSLLVARRFQLAFPSCVSLLDY